jgi:integration host factor subunit beta
MVKSELIQELCNSFPSLLRRDLESAVNIVFDEIIIAMSQQKNCEFRNFGIFKTKIREAHQARNPKTGEKIDIERKVVPIFKMSKLMKIELNKEV